MNIKETVLDLINQTDNKYDFLKKISNFISLNIQRFERRPV